MDMKQTMQNQMGIGAEIIEQVWERIRPYELPALREMPSERILVIRGSYDHIEKILDNAKVPYALLNEFPNKEDIYQGGRFHHSNVIFVNCDANYHGNLGEKNLTRDNKKAMQEFVARGGRMVTTDWAQSVVRYLFGKIRAKENITEDEVVKVKFSSDVGRKLSGIVYGNAKPNWWLEGSSDMIRYSQDSYRETCRK